MILIDSIYINKSGGKVLLELLLEATNSESATNEFVFLIDNRLKTEYSTKYHNKNFIFLNASEKNRREFYKGLLPEINCILCFANIPPPVSVQSKAVFIYFHNALLLKSAGMGYSLKKRLGFLLKRFYILYRNKSNYVWFVQTPNMKKHLLNSLHIKESKVIICAFYKNHITRVNKQLPTNDDKFLYVADGVKQKNHDNLLKAWKIVVKTNPDLELHLTVPDSFSSLISEIDSLRRKDCKIINHGYCTEQELTQLYSTCNYLIFPSFTESFGLPLIEAATAGCEIISADLPYVYDVVKPLLVFDPYSITSIAKAITSVVKRTNTGTEIVVQNQINKLLETIKN